MTWGRPSTVHLFKCVPNENVCSSLGKTIQTLTRMVDNPATREDRDDGFSASTL